ncbi:MAG: hypothetical protein A4E19_03220 [Nitrospira sp. SG-bin1]|nr:MAG: hypothetical protein A4E19_03220 [Nitrospira sp. SG-bin1]
MTVMCQGCRTVSFCIESQFSEDYEYDEHEDGYYVKRYELYPNRITGRPEMDSARDIPEGIYDLYAETRTALCSNQPILTGIGIRAIVEAVCKDRGATGHNLEKRIDSLVILKIVTEDGAKILHNLRFMGNDAAHEVKAHKIDELSIAFGVLEYLLQGVYIMPKQASMLPQNIKILPKKPKP